MLDLFTRETLTFTTEFITAEVKKTYTDILHSLQFESPMRKLYYTNQPYGKSFLLNQIFQSLTNSDVLNKTEIAFLPNKVYGIVSFEQFLAYIYNLTSKVRNLTNNIKPDKDTIIDLLHEKISAKPQVLIIDNFDLLVSKIGHDVNRLFAFLNTYPNIMLIASACDIDTIDNKIKDLFDICPAPSMTQDEVRQVLTSYNQEQINKDLPILETFLEGNHLYYSYYLSSAKQDLGLAQNLINTGEKLGYYFQTKCGGLSFQQQGLLDFIARHQTAITATQISEELLLDINSVTKQLSEIYKSGFLAKHAIGREVYYEVVDPLYKLYIERSNLKRLEAYVGLHYLVTSQSNLNKLSIPNILYYHRYDVKEVVIKTALIKTHPQNLVAEETSRSEIRSRAFIISLMGERLNDVNEEIKQYGIDPLHKSAYTVAMNHINMEIKTDPNRIQNHLFKGALYHFRKEYGQAFTQYEIALKLDSNNVQVNLFLGLLFLDTQEDKTTIKYISKVLDIEPYNSLALGILGYAQIKQQAFDAAIATFNTVLKNDLHYFALVGIGEIYLLRGEYDLSKTSLNKALNENEKQEYNAYVYTDIANIHLINGEIRQATSMYENAITTNPKLIEAHYGLAHVYLQNNDLDIAIKKIQQILEKKPDHEFCKMLLSTAYLQLGSYDKVLNALLNKIDKNSTNYDLSILISSTALLYQEELTQAFNLLERQSTTSKEAYFLLGVIEERAQNMDGAIKNYNLSLNIDGSFMPAIINIGYYFVEKQNFYLAKKHFKHAHDIIPSDENIILMLIYISTQEKDFHSASIFLNKLKVTKQHIICTIASAEIMIQENKMDEAEQIFLSHMQTNEYLPTLQVLLLSLYIKQEQYTKIINYVEQNKDNIQTDEAYNIAGMAYEQMRNTEEATYYFEKALNLKPSSIEARTNLIKALISNGEIAKAMTLFESMISSQNKDVSCKTTAQVYMAICQHVSPSKIKYYFEKIDAMLNKHNKTINIEESYQFLIINLIRNQTSYDKSNNEPIVAQIEAIQDNKTPVLHLLKTMLLLTTNHLGVKHLYTDLTREERKLYLAL
jgi:tetratricopeptide (TPR) repeat protein